MTDYSGTALGLRMSLLGWSLVLVPGAALGAALATVWITSVSVIALGVGIPLTLLATVLVRWFADLHRRWAADRLGVPVDRPYRPTPDAGWPVRLWALLRDPATWRDWAWLAVNSLTAWLSCGLSLLFFLAGIAYLIYPLLYQLTPPEVLRSPLGDGFRLDSVAQSFVLVPLGPVFLLLWYTTAERLANLNARVMMAQGRSNAAIAARMFVTERTVSKHSNNIFLKLGLKASEDDNRRILAVLAYLEG